MTQMEQRMKEAFAEMAAPDDVKSATLAAIEQRRAAQAGGVAAERAAAASGGATRRGQRRWRVIVPLAMAAALTLAFVGIGGMWATHGSSPQQPASAPVLEAAAHVGIDVNPSVELAVSAEGEVLAVDALNDDADALLSQMDLSGLPYEQALEDLFDSDAFAPYRAEGMLVEVDVVAEDDALAEQLQNQTEVALSTLPCASVCVRTDEEHRQAAAAAGMGMGRYRAASELMALDPSVSLEDCAHLTMAELHGRINECTGEGMSYGQQGGAQGGHGSTHGAQGSASGDGAHGAHGYHGGR